MLDNTYIEQFQIPGFPLQKTPDKDQKRVFFNISRGFFYFELPEYFEDRTTRVTVEIYDFYGAEKKLVYRDITNRNVIFKRDDSVKKYKLSVRVPVKNPEYNPDPSAPDLYDYRIVEPDWDFRTAEAEKRIVVTEAEELSEGYDPTQDYLVIKNTFNPDSGSFFLKIITPDSEISKVLTRKQHL